jgi:hypothetical protein
MPVAKTYVAFFDGHLDHPDTQKLAGELERLGMPRRWRDWAGTVAPLLNLWCLQHQEDGDVTHLPAERIAQICRWPLGGKSEEFVSALKVAGVVDEVEMPGGGTRYVVHNFRHYCRRLLTERERKRNSRREVHDNDNPAPSTRTVRGQSAPASANRLAPIVIGSVIGSVNGNLKDREGTLTVVTDEPEKQPTPAGASRPTSEISETTTTAGNGNGNGNARPQAEGPGPETAPDRDPQRPEDVQACVSMLAELLRRWGWNEMAVRRFLKWLITDSRGPGCALPRGAWVLRTCEGDYWRILGLVKQVEERKAQGGDVRDTVSLTIHMIDKGYHPNAQCLRLAKSAWIFLDGEEARAEPIWMREVLASIGAPAVKL